MSIYFVSTKFIRSVIETLTLIRIPVFQHNSLNLPGRIVPYTFKNKIYFEYPFSNSALQKYQDFWTYCSNIRRFEYILFDLKGIHLKSSTWSLFVGEQMNKKCHINVPISRMPSYDNVYDALRTIVNGNKPAGRPDVALPPLLWTSSEQNKQGRPCTNYRGVKNVSFFESKCFRDPSWTSYCDLKFIYQYHRNLLLPQILYFKKIWLWFFPLYYGRWKLCITLSCWTKNWTGSLSWSSRSNNFKQSIQTLKH